MTEEDETQQGPEPGGATSAGDGSSRASSLEAGSAGEETRAPEAQTAAEPGPVVTPSAQGKPVETPVPAAVETVPAAPAEVTALKAATGRAPARNLKPAAKRPAPRATARKAQSSPPVKKSGSLAPAVVQPLRPTTLAIDIGGTGLKASVLDAAGKLVADRVRVVTPYPCTPKVLVDALVKLVAPLPAYDRVSVGFPGVVRKGLVLTAPHFSTKKGLPGEAPSPKLLAAWTGFDLAGSLGTRLGRPVRVANDADLQGLDVVSGSGLEFVVTLGTGVGTALFLDGRLAPHLELAHIPFRGNQTYDEQLGDATLRRVGAKKWRKRLEDALVNFNILLNYDRLYIGGGNSRLLVGHVDPSVVIVDNLAGILGGIKLWEHSEN
jgi:polyphosphate glucokinase